MSEQEPSLECWFLTGSQALYGEETLHQVAEQSRQIVTMLADGPEISIRLVWKPVLTGADEIRRICLDASASDNCVGVIAWMHTFSPAKAWIAGLEALRKPLLHFHTQVNVSLPWDQIDMDFMNLNQAAHGDREFGYIETRMGVLRKTVAGHASRSGGPVTDRGVEPGRARDWHAAQGLRMARFGDNMRDVAVTEGDKVEAQIKLGVSVNAYGVNDLVAAVDARLYGGGRRDRRRIRATSTTSSPSSPSAARGTNRCATPPGSRSGCGRFLDDGGFSAFTTNFEDLGGLRQLPGIAVQRLMADGYGFGGGGRLEDSRAAPDLQGDGRRPARGNLIHGGLHVPSRAGGAQGPRRAHARGVPEHRGRHADLRDPPARHRRPG